MNEQLIESTEISGDTLASAMLSTHDSESHLNNQQDSHSRKPHFIWWHWLFIAIAVAVTFTLAWWQLCRFNSISGTAQNLGYTLQWPFFGGFVVYAYLKYCALERQAKDSSTRIDPLDNKSMGNTRKSFWLSQKFHVIYKTNNYPAQVMHEIPAGILPQVSRTSPIVDASLVSGQVYLQNTSVQDGEVIVMDAEEQEMQDYNRYLQSLAQENTPQTGK